MGSRADIKLEEEREAFLFGMQLATAASLPMVLKSAIELELFELIAKSGPMGYVSPLDLAHQLPAHHSGSAVMLDRILRLLASYSILKCKARELHDGRVERVYGLAPVCKFFTRNSDGVSLAPILLMNHDKVFMETWYHLKDAVVEGGIPFNKAFGMTAFEYPGTDPRFNKVFNQGMFDHSTIIMNKILETYTGFNALTSLVDVGGGIGATLQMILSKYPMIKGINFDLPHVVKEAPTYPGVTHVGGDMFVSVPKGDAIFMKWICHDWSDEYCLKLLKNCYEAIPSNGKVIIAECILPETPDATLATKTVIHVDVMMLAYNPGGKERTEKEFEALAKDAGFKSFNKTCCAFNFWIMELCK